MVVHLVVVIRERGRVTFESANLRGSQNVGAAAASEGVGHIIYLGNAPPHFAFEMTLDVPATILVSNQQKWD